jgi:ferredoxin
MAHTLDKPKYEVVGELEQYEEADNVQARAALVPGSDLWIKYYTRHPELEKKGYGLAQLAKTRTVNPVQDGLMMGSVPWAIRVLATEEAVDGTPSPDRIIIEPERASFKVKAFARHLGVDIVRIGPVNQAWVYKHVGRSHSQDVVIGTPINLPHTHAIVVAVGLNRDMVKTAPQLPIGLETMRAYLRLASIVVTLARYIRTLGYSARAHNLMNYQALLVPLAVDAGLGELARHGIVINETYGSAMKIAAVTTDLPLINDKPVDLRVSEFCQECGICSRYCPVSAIPKGDKIVAGGVRKWKINDIACFSYWRRVGTDCGICMAVCPWTRPRHLPHNSILWAVEHSHLARKVAIKADGVFGHRNRKECPSWLEEQPQSWREVLSDRHPYFRSIK